MAGGKLNIPILVGQNEELYTISMSDEEYVQIMNGDQALLQRLVTEETEKRNRNIIQQVVNTSQDNNLDMNSSTYKSDNIEENQHKEDEENKNEAFNWPEKAVLLFLELYREREPEFTTGLKRHNKIWSEIASDLKNSDYKVSAVQVQNKMSSLKRTYKKIKDSNAKSGNHNSSWMYYSAMDSIFGEKSWVSPPAVASSDGPSIPSELVKSSSSCSTYSMDLGCQDIVSKPKKRKVETILESFILNLQNNRDEQKEERRLERKEKENRKEQMWEAYRTEKREMHKETSEIQRSLVDLLGKLVEKGNK